MKCQNCGNEVKEGAKFCRECGAQIAAQTKQASVNVCPRCGKVLENGVIYCDKCGAVLAEEPTASVSGTGKICPHCGNRLNPAAMFCGNCGNSLNPNSVKKGKREIKDNNSRGKKNTGVIVLTVLLIAVIIASAAVILYLCNGGEFFDNIGKGQEIEADKDERRDKELEKEEKEPYEVEVKDDLIDMDVIDAIIASDANNARIGVCVIDMKNDVTYSTLNATERMSASALINIPVLYVIGKDMEENYISFDTPIKFQYKYSGRGTIGKNKNGEYLELSELLSQMLNYSDNNATNSLIDYYGYGTINSVCSEYSYNSVNLQKYLGETSDYKDNYISAEDISHMLYDMYKSEGNGINKTYLLSNFRISDNTKLTGIGKSLPQNEVLFLNHNAVTSSIYNEVAIVTSEKAEYIITVLCNDGKTEAEKTTVSKISEYVYNALNG